MFRSSMRALALAACLAVPGLRAATVPGTAYGEAAPVATAEDVEGSGWKSFAVCVGCVAAGIAILAGGATAIVGAASAPGSTLALGGCIAACSSM